MTESEYGIAKAAPSLPARDLLRVPHRGKVLVVSWPPFGPNTYARNVEQMPGPYSNSADLPVISFRPATTAESISVAAYKFKSMAKPEIFEPRWLQAGRIVRTSEGVYVNPPIKEGNPVTDESELKSLLDGGKKIKVGEGNIYFMQAPEIRDFGFAEYESFKQGVQDSGDFAKGGLARILEHTMDCPAPNLRKISSSEHYKRGVNVFGLDEVSEPVVSVVSLYSDRYIGGGRLDVGGFDWDGDDGSAFGVFDSGEASASKNSE